ncbi:hypothetical protein G3N55_02405 [Dissulfurirhabdus thermomarina]|uniref:Na/Pi cotransporter family protein n=1 Tax=Dissulfurirhabdus thermomarina TaxID=1765737 RepID=A0A6N9TKD2_DISTH|nr:Na/Pi symporter [Dissulfurirhabdus thermomarina]NDY41705.1 hypothetical protein [Dissulfurirhabdus thermomarina]NMX23190.1 Na/Pi symporter [Dissulfurirhabdus thermomarina]
MPRPPLPARPGRSVLERLRGPALFVAFLCLLYAFFLSIGGMQAAFKGMGAGFSRSLFTLTHNPVVGLFVGILSTSLIQSSSTTTSLVVALVASGALDVTHAIPIVMGANIGTSVTNTLVSLGHITRSSEFRRAFAAATVHDFFNLLTVTVLLPVEMATGYLARTSTLLAEAFSRAGGLTFTSPVKAVTKPVIHAVHGAFEAGLGEPLAGICLLAAGFVVLFAALAGIVKVMRLLLMGRLEVAFNRFVGGSALGGMGIGLVCTALVQSSSVTTSLLVPLAGAGILGIRQVFPVTLGANVGTTVTALLAAMAVETQGGGPSGGLVVALSHLLFNLTGIALIYPVERIRRIPINLARRLALAATRKKRVAFYYVLGVFFLAPLLLIGITDFQGLVRLFGGA